MVWVRGLMGQGKYEEASELLRERLKGAVGAERVEISRWLIEISLRMDEPRRVEEWLGEFDAPGKNSKQRKPLPPNSPNLSTAFSRQCRI
jgi:hypothetical protein